MPWWRRLRSGVRGLWRRDRRQRELEEELRFHLERQAEENARAGMGPEQARRAAVLRFGGVEGIKEECRDSWGGRLVETLAQDVRHGLRTLAKSPGFTAAVVLTLALGIGANTAVFSVVNGVLLRPLPYPGSEQLVILRQAVPGAGIEDLGFSVKEVEDFRDQNRTLEEVIEYHSMSFTLLGGSEPRRVRTGVVSARFFDVLGVKPHLGRTFQAGEDAHGADPVLVLSHEYWREGLGADPEVLGRRFEMNDRVHTVVGVLPPLPQYPEYNDVYMPASACPFRARSRENRSARLLLAFGRIKPGVSPAQAGADLAAVGDRLRRAHPAAYPSARRHEVRLASLGEELVREARPTFLVLLATVALVLLIGCANVANLTLARAVERGRELAVRAALGAGRGRLLRQMLTESTLIALVGGALGLLFAAVSLDLLRTFAARFSPRAAEVTIDGRVLLFTLVVSLLTGLAFGSLPALPGREQLGAALTSESGRTSAGRSRQRLRFALAVSQLALSFMLLMGAALMLRSFSKLQAVEPGFRTEDVLTARIDLNWSNYVNPERPSDNERALGFYHPLLERVRTFPGVVSAGYAWTFPLNSGFRTDGTFQVEGRPDADRPPATAQFIGASPDYFEVLGVPVLRGRSFAESDRGEAAPVVVVNRTLARRHFGDDDPVGRRLSSNRGRDWRTIVGVVGDVRQEGLDQEPRETVYLPFYQFPGFSCTLFVRTLAEPTTIVSQVAAAVRDLDPQTVMSETRTLEQVRHESLASPRLTTLLLGLFAALALAITATGIGGVIAFSVSQRTHEIGIRMALGAAPGHVLRMVLRQGLGSALLGVAVGVAGALGLAQLVSSLLFGVEPTDPACFAGSTALLLVVATAACLVPARRATAIDPMQALRAE
jgi:predicted permease